MESGVEWSSHEHDHHRGANERLEHGFLLLSSATTTSSSFHLGSCSVYSLLHGCNVHGVDMADLWAGRVEKLLRVFFAMASRFFSLSRVQARLFAAAPSPHLTSPRRFACPSLSESERAHVAMLSPCLATLSLCAVPLSAPGHASLPCADQAIAICNRQYHGIVQLATECRARSSITLSHRYRCSLSIVISKILVSRW
jgi:hypothetical protein